MLSADATTWTARSEAQESPERKCGWNTMSRGGACDVGGAGHPFKQAGDRRPCDIGDRLRDVDDARPHKSAPGHVVDADERHVGRAAEAEIEDRLQRAERHHIVGADDRGRPIGARHQRLRRVVGDVALIVAGNAQRRVDRSAGGLHRFEERGEPLVAVHSPGRCR